MGFMDRTKAAINVLLDRTTDDNRSLMSSMAAVSTSHSHHRSYDTRAAVLAPIKTRIAIDAASMVIRHVRVDHLDRFVEALHSELNDRLTIMANTDQSGTAFIQDAVMTMLEEGVCALVPVEVSSDPNTGAFDILSLRVGVVKEWFSQAVRVSVYNEYEGVRVDRILPKSYVAICPNPMWQVMNDNSSTLNRLRDKLSLMDVSDNKLYSPGLDVIIQMPFSLQTDKRVAEAQRRLETLTSQLQSSQYGVAYLDPAEKITQLNRPVNNTLLEQIKTLTESLHSQLGLTPAIFSGTASEAEILLYNNRTILPILKSLTDGMRATFFTRTAVRQGHSIMAFPSLFKMAPLAHLADAADKLTRNEILSSNEVRGFIGLEPSKSPEADELRNKNLNKQVGDDRSTVEEKEKDPTITKEVTNE